MGYRDDECKPCNSGKTPWSLCIVLAVGAGLYHSVADEMGKSPDPWEKATGVVVKGFGKVLDSAFDYYCQC